MWGDGWERQEDHTEGLNTEMSRSTLWRRSLRSKSREVKYNFSDTDERDPDVSHGPVCWSSGVQFKCSFTSSHLMRQGERTVTETLPVYLFHDSNLWMEYILDHIRVREWVLPLYLCFKYIGHYILSEPINPQSHSLWVWVFLKKEE